MLCGYRRLSLELAADHLTMYYIRVVSRPINTTRVVFMGRETTGFNGMYGSIMQLPKPFVDFFWVRPSQTLPGDTTEACDPPTLP